MTKVVLDSGAESVSDLASFTDANRSASDRIIQRSRDRGDIVEPYIPEFDTTSP